MGGYVEPYFGPLVELASHLVRNMYTEEIDPNSSTFVTFRDDYDTKVGTKLKDKIMMNEDTWWYFFTAPNLLEVIMKNQYETEAYGKALAHLCYGN